MQSKPEQFQAIYAETFKDQQVVDAYRFRPPYPAEVFSLLKDLLKDEPRTVLDVGAGSGDIARHLVEYVDRIDAVDVSLPMIERGRHLPLGDHARLSWISGKVEEVDLTPPYALIVAGSSIHWTDWPVAFPRFRALLSPAGALALVYRHTLPMPWSDEIRALRARYSSPNIYETRNVIMDLRTRGWFQVQGQRETAPVAFSQTIDEFIEGLHSRSRFSRELLGAQRAATFDQQVRSVLQSYHPDGHLPLQVVAIVVWGQPIAGSPA